MTEVALPDVVPLVVAYLRGQSLLAGVTVGARRPSDLASLLPFVLVERVGAMPRQRRFGLTRRVDRARVGLQVWARPREGDALAVARAALATLYAARGVSLPDGTITRVDALGDPVSAPDAAVNGNVFRMVAMVEVTVR